MSRQLAQLAQLAEQTDTPIYHQLRVEFAVRKLVADITPMVEGFAVFAAKVRQAEAERAAWMAPEAVLGRIRSDQASLDWRDQWAAERGQL